MTALTEFSTLYARVKPALLRLLRGRFGKNAQDAEDAAQEILLRAHAHGATHWPTQKDDETRYLHTVTRNHVTDEWRSQGRGAGPQFISLTEVESQALALCANAAASPEETAANRQLIERVSDAVDELPARQRQAFLLNRIDGHSYEEVALRMGISSRMAAKHISRALAYCEMRAQYASLQQMREAGLHLEAEQAPNTASERSVESQGHAR